MKIDLEGNFAGHVIRSYAAGVIQVNEKQVADSLILTREDLVLGWAPATVDELQLAHFQCVRDYLPEVLLLGTGSRQHYPDMRLLAELAAQGMGIEVMDTASACRTYNILLADQRRVAAALFQIQP